MTVIEAGDLQGVVPALRRFLSDPPRGSRRGAGEESAFDPDRLSAQVLALRPA